jgi:hypothetical protein
MKFLRKLYLRWYVNWTKHYTAIDLMFMEKTKRDKIMNAQFELWELEDNDDYEILEANEIIDD